MYKAFIVDDEPSIRSGLKNIIPWEEYGIELIGEASNGQEAYEFIRENQPEVVICDIRMPVMTGLELIGRVREEGIPSRFVILSGYDDFQYVKEALQYQVENYLLKPINEEELEQTIYQLTAKLESDFQRSLEHSRERELLRNNVLNRVLANQIDPFEFKHKLQFIHTGINLTEGKLQVLAIDWLVPPSSTASEAHMDHVKTVEALCMETIPENMAVVFIDLSGRVVIIFKVDSVRSHREMVQGQIRSVYERSPKPPGVKWVITAGDIADNYKTLYLSYQQALEVQPYRLFYKEGEVIDYGEVQATTSADHRRVVVDYDRLETAILNGRRDEIRQYVNDCLEQWSGGGMSPDSVYTFVMEVVVSLLRIVRSQGLVESELFDDETLIMRSIHDFKDMNELAEWLREKMLAAADLIEEQNAQQVSKLTKDLLVYIDKHYGEDISLKGYAQEIYYNPIYLGRLFRNETGEVFSEYVNKVRIEKSKQLLRGTSLKVSEIASSIGFNNSNYYCNIFKKMTGVTPSHYRNE